MATQTTKATFMVISDTHNFEMDAHPTCPLAGQLPKVDVLLHCGDLTQVGGLSAYKKALRLLSTFDAELKLVIAGNHDISLDGEYWRTHLDEDDEPEEHDEAVEIMTGRLAKDAGVTYLTEGLHSFTLKNGVKFTIYASPYQPECGEWAFGYPRTQDKFGNAIPEGVDLVMTHGPPKGILDHIPYKDEHAGCESLAREIERVKPLLHCFGHIHEGYGAEMKEWMPAGKLEGGREGETQIVKVSHGVGTESNSVQHTVIAKESTLFVNAAIMDGSNKPVNAPWLIELPFPLIV